MERGRNCERCVESVKRLEAIKAMSVCDAKLALLKDSGKPQPVSYCFDLEERDRFWRQTGDVDGKSGWIETNCQHDDKDDDCAARHTRHGLSASRWM
jgi:hypothetical protein